MLLFLLIPLITVLYCVWNWWPRIQRMRALCEAGRKTKPLFTNSHWLLGDLPEIQRIGMDGLYEKYLEFIRDGQHVCVIWRTRFAPEFMLLHPDAIRQILRKADPKPSRFNLDYGVLYSWLGDGLLTTTASKWERNRKLLTPGFHFNVLKPYIEIYNKSTDVLLDKLAKHGTMVDIFPAMALCTYEILLQCALSYHDDIQVQGNIMYYPDTIFNISKVGRAYNKTLAYVHGFAEKIIDTRVEYMKDNPGSVGKKYLDFLDILLAARDEEGRGLSKAEIRNEVDTFMFAGHDTTASASAWFLYALAEHPDVQQRIHEEIESLLGDRKYVEWDDLPNMPYFTNSLKESMRIRSPVPLIAREITEPLNVDGVTIPASSVVGVVIYSLHHSDTYWENPEEFRPERYEEDTFAKRDPYSYIPFSAGPRFKISLVPDNVAIPYPWIVLHAKNGMRLNFSPRE